MFKFTLTGPEDAKTQTTQEEKILIGEPDRHYPRLDLSLDTRHLNMRASLANDQLDKLDSAEYTYISKN